MNLIILWSIIDNDNDNWRFPVDKADYSKARERKTIWDNIDYSNYLIELEHFI
jgi:hypothetical protein